MNRVGKILAGVATLLVLAAGGCQGVAGDEKRPPPPAVEADEFLPDER